MRLRWNDASIQAQAPAIAAQIDAAGYCQIDDFIGPEDLRSLAAQAHAAVDRNGGEYLSFSQADAFGNPVWQQMCDSPTLKRLAAALYDRAGTGSVFDEDVYAVVRCLKGVTARRHSNYFHFDSYVVTILLPVVIPSTGLTGNLVIFPNARPIRAAYWRNVLDKMLSDTWPAQRLYRRRAHHPRSRAVSLKLEPGSAVLFWGYRSLHANEPCDSDTLRATALLHFGNPHGRSRRRAQGGSRSGSPLPPLSSGTEA